MTFDRDSGARVRTLREAAGLTQEQVAESMGVAVSTVSRLERGASGINTSRLPALAASLGVSVSNLFSALAEDEPSGSRYANL